MPKLPKLPKRARKQPSEAGNSSQGPTDQALANHALVDEALTQEADLDTHLVSLVPTPIGNLGDMTLRSLETLRQADGIAAEDTRRSKTLLQHFAINKPLERLDAHTMRERAPTLIKRYRHLAFVTDAGTPGLSDPGAELVTIALQAGARVEALPGANALLPALVLSGLPIHRFSFFGFLPRSGRERRAWLETIARSSIPVAIYESPHRIAETLDDLIKACGSARSCTLARELTKRFEEIFRGSLSEALTQVRERARGEFVIVIGGKSATSAYPEDDMLADEPNSNRPDRDQLLALAKALATRGASVREIRTHLQEAGLERNEAYALALQVSKEEHP